MVDVRESAVTSSGRGLLLCLFTLIHFTPLLANETQPDVIAGPVLHLGHQGLWLHLVAKGLKAPRVEWKLTKQSAIGDGLRKIAKDSWVSSPVPLQPAGSAYRLSDGLWRSPWYEVSPPRSGGRSLTFALYGDNRAGSGDALVHRLFVEKIAAERPDFVIHTGDLVVNANRLRHWRHLFGELHPLVSQIPFMPSKGNHDVSKTDRYEYFFPMNGNKSYYTFDYKGVTFIALDTEINFRKGSAQYRFVEKVLGTKSPDDPVIVFFHIPAHSYAAHGSDRMVRRHLVPLFSRYGVDVVFSGHEHGYQRFRTIGGVSYVIAAGGGTPLYRVTASPRLEMFRVVYNVVLVTIDRDRRLKGRMMNVQGVIEDEFEIQL